MSSVVRTITGIEMMPSAIAPAIAEKRRIVATTIVPLTTNKPTTIDGALRNASLMNRTTDVSLLRRPYSAR